MSPRKRGVPRDGSIWYPVGTLQLRGGGGEPVDLRRTLVSHGVAMLPPQQVDAAAATLETTVALPAGGARTFRVRGSSNTRAAVEVLAAGPPAAGRPPVAERADRPPVAERAELLAVARRCLSLDEDLSPFYERVRSDTTLAWAAAGAGRMLRGPTVFEDVVKTICTTNCAWSATVRMTTRIVEGLGEPASGGRRAFPSPAAMAAAPESFYREEARAGYRGAYLQRLAVGVAQGTIGLEELRDAGVPDDEVLRRLLALPGVGPYGAAHIMLTSLGRYRRLVLDSWTRPTYAALAGRATPDRTIERRFRRYGAHAGLAFWLVLTKDWLDD